MRRLVLALLLAWSGLGWAAGPTTVVRNADEDHLSTIHLEPDRYKAGLYVEKGLSVPSGGLRVGDASNYSEIETDGTLVAHGDATTWTDSMVPATAARTAAADLALQELTTGIYAPRVDLNDEIYSVVQFPHGLKTSGAVTIKPHIHLVNKNAIGASAYNVAFDLQWGWLNIGATGLATTTQSNKRVSFQNDGAITHKILAFDDIVASAGQGGISSLFFCRVKRVTAGANPYDTNDIFFGGFDIHFEQDTIGSRTPTSKEANCFPWRAFRDRPAVLAKALSPYEDAMKKLLPLILLLVAGTALAVGPTTTVRNADEDKLSTIHREPDRYKAGLYVEQGLEVTSGGLKVTGGITGTYVGATPADTWTGDVVTDSIVEETENNGVVVEGVTAKDNGLATQLGAGEQGLTIDAASTANTRTDGVIEVLYSTATSGGEAVNIDFGASNAAPGTASAIFIDVDDDTSATTSVNGLYVEVTDIDGAAGSTVNGVLVTGADAGVYVTAPATGKGVVVDAATADSTQATGVVDVDWDSKTASSEAVNIKATHLTGGTGQTISAVELELDADSGNAGDVLQGLFINATDTTATGKVNAIQISGAGLNAAIQANTGYVRIGTGSTPDVTPGDDDLYVEGTVEVDGAARFDGAATFNAGANFGYSLATDNVVLTAADCGKTLAIATDAKTYTLPATVAGCRYTFINAGANGNNIVELVPNAADQVFGTVTLASSVVVVAGAAGEHVVNTKATAKRGDSMTLVGDGADGWYIVASTGIWAEATP